MILYSVQCLTCLASGQHALRISSMVTTAAPPSLLQALYLIKDDRMTYNIRFAVATLGALFDQRCECA
jgi:hypothetical protein